MKLLFLGTGAADWPLKKKEGMTEFRRLSSLLIDDVLLIDPGPQVLEALLEYGKDASNIKYIINTHKHSDHFNIGTLEKLEELGAEFLEFADGEEKTVGDYTVRAYSGNHSTCKGTVHFVISDRERTLFYGLDGAWLLCDEVKAIQKYTPDLAVLDATIGFVDGDYRVFEHNNLNMVLEMKKSLDKYVGRFCISHMARTLHTDHKTLSEAMDKYGVLAARDGLEIEI
ncbi:MAG: MBL fold metallo-hydrolase [Ruminococcaceae bacterium]|nr:MBL fold metallo-hydrolase [Oscillospiraceae bacterium]